MPVREAVGHPVHRQAVPSIAEITTVAPSGDRSSSNISFASSPRRTSHRGGELPRSDLAATLLVALMREQTVAEFVDSLRKAVNEADGFRVVLTLRPEGSGYTGGHIGAVVTVATGDGAPIAASPSVR